MSRDKSVERGFTVFVNSSDGFEDCWDPFFTLFKKYWPQCRAPILLNTERKEFRHRLLDVTSTKVAQGSDTRLTWSQCTLAGLSRVATPLVMYFQEDYFLQRQLDHKRLMDAVRLMVARPEVKHIALTKFGSLGPYDRYSEPWLLTIGPRARYRISTQAALWRVDTLSSYVVPEENGWMFEIYGTWRAWRRRECFLIARFDAEQGGPVVDYLHTGVIKGKWLRGIQDVFAKNGITVDYSRRGFYVSKPAVVRRFETGGRLLQRPGYLLKQLLGR